MLLLVSSTCMRSCRVFGGCWSKRKSWMHSSTKVCALGRLDLHAAPDSLVKPALYDILSWFRPGDLQTAVTVQEQAMKIASGECHNRWAPHLTLCTGLDKFASVKDVRSRLKVLCTASKRFTFSSLSGTEKRTRYQIACARTSDSAMQALRRRSGDSSHRCVCVPQN